ncbi:DUF6882 domain-containing protein [Nocardioides sp. YJ-D4]
MALFRRARASTPPSPSPHDTDLSTLLLEGEAMIEQLANAHASTWGLGTADRWGLDQQTGTITWTFPDKTATAPAQILGNYNAGAGSWMWAWANDSILPAMRTDAEAIRSWANDTGNTNLTVPKFEADDELAATLAAIAVRITRATGFYRSSGPSSVFITFGPVTITPTDGEPSTFSINIGD